MERAEPELELLVDNLASAREIRPNEFIRVGVTY